MQVNEISSRNNTERVGAYEVEEDLPFNSVPREILREIFSYLSADLVRAAQVCRYWRGCARDVITLKDKEAFKKYGAFGAAKWAKYFGEVGEEPPIPRGIFAWLDGPSVKTEDPREKRGETGLFFLMPEKVNGKDLSLNYMEELAGNAKGEWRSKYRYYRDGVRSRYGTDTVGKSYWAWMSTALFFGSRYKTYERQDSMVKNLGNGYELPKALEAVVLNIAWYVSHKGEKLFGNGPRIYTRCQELIDDKGPLVVGGFNSDGLIVDNNDVACDCCGAAACWKFRPLAIGT